MALVGGVSGGPCSIGERDQDRALQPADRRPPQFAPLGRFLCEQSIARKFLLEMRHASLICASLTPRAGPPVRHFNQLHMPPKVRALLREIGVDIQHATVIVAHEPKAIVEHDISHARRVDQASTSFQQTGSCVKHPVT